MTGNGTGTGTGSANGTGMGTGNGAGSANGTGMGAGDRHAAVIRNGTQRERDRHGSRCCRRDRHAAVMGHGKGIGTGTGQASGPGMLGPATRAPGTPRPAFTPRLLLARFLAHRPPDIGLFLNRPPCIADTKRAFSWTRRVLQPSRFARPLEHPPHARTRTVGLPPSATAHDPVRGPTRRKARRGLSRWPCRNGFRATKRPIRPTCVR